MPGSTTFTARSATLRETAKWIAAGFTGAGAILFSGLVYTNIQSQTAAPYWGVLLGLSVLPVVAAAWALREAAQIASLDPPDVSPLLPKLEAARTGQDPDVSATRDQKDIDLHAAVNRLAPPPVVIYGSVEQFDDQIATAMAAARAAQGRYAGDRRVERRIEAEQAQQALDSLGSGVEDIASAADFHQTSAAYAKARIRFLLAAALAIGSMLAVGIVSANTRPAKSAATSVATATSMRIFLRGDEPTKLVADTENPPRKCPIWDGMIATAIGGTLEEPLLVFEGSQLDTAKEPIEAAVKSACADGWLWQADKRVVTVVPT